MCLYRIENKYRWKNIKIKKIIGNNSFCATYGDGLAKINIIN